MLTFDGAHSSLSPCALFCHAQSTQCSPRHQDPIAKAAGLSLSLCGPQHFNVTLGGAARKVAAWLLIYLGRIEDCVVRHQGQVLAAIAALELLGKQAFLGPVQILVSRPGSGWGVVLKRGEYLPAKSTFAGFATSVLQMSVPNTQMSVPNTQISVSTFQLQVVVLHGVGRSESYHQKTKIAPAFSFGGEQKKSAQLVMTATRMLRMFRIPTRKDFCAS